MGHAVNDTKQKLIDTALELIWKSSYGSVSVDDICKAADVKKGSFYHFFPSKVDLAVAAMDESTRLSREVLDRAFSPGLNPIERFERYADVTVEMQVDVAKRYGRACGCPCISLGSELAGQEDVVSAKFNEIMRLKERYFENALRDMVVEGLLPDDTDVKAKAHEIHAWVMGQLTLVRIQNDLGPLERDLKPGLLNLLGIRKTEQQVA